MSQAEISQYRSIVGSLIYLYTWARWDLACSTSICAQRTLKAIVADARALNKAAAVAIIRPDLGVTVRRGIVDLTNCEFVCCKRHLGADCSGGVEAARFSSSDSVSLSVWVRFDRRCHEISRTCLLFKPIR